MTNFLLALFYFAILIVCSFALITITLYSIWAAIKSDSDLDEETRRFK